MEKIAAIDIGVTGAIVIRDSKIPRNEQNAWLMYDIPVIAVQNSKGGKKHVYNREQIYAIFQPIAADLKGAIIEDIHAIGAKPMGGRGAFMHGAQANFSLGYGLGTFETIFSILKIPFFKVNPNRWKSIMLKGVGKKSDKDQVRNFAMQAYPELAAYFSRKMDHNRAEAVLMCDYAMQHQFPDMDGWVEFQRDVDYIAENPFDEDPEE